MDIAIASVACLALLQFLLAFNVSLNRMASRRSIGHSEDPADPLHRAVVAHRNACEYAPMFSILILLGPAAGTPAWSLWLGPTVVLVRVVHAASLAHFTLGRPTMLRRLGAGLTYTLGLLMAVLLLYTRVSR